MCFWHDTRGLVSLKPVSEREPQSAWGLGNCPIVRTTRPTIFRANIALLKSFVHICQFLQTGKHAAYKTPNVLGPFNIQLPPSVSPLGERVNGLTCDQRKRLKGKRAFGNIVKVKVIKRI